MTGPAVPIVVRVARPEEYERAGRITVDAYLRDGFIAVDHPYAERLADAASRARDAVLLVAERGGPGPSIVGTVTFCRAPSQYAELAGEGDAEFRMLAVDPAARGAGVGHALVQACIELATEAGDRRIMLSTQPGMAAAARVYERLGFARRPELDWSPVLGIDLLAYARDLAG